MVPRLQELKKEGEAGRKKINQYTRYGTVVLARSRPSASRVGLEARASAHRPGLGLPPGDVMTLTGGTVFLMWLGEQITEHGIGNGISLIILAGIVADLPRRGQVLHPGGAPGAQPGRVPRHPAMMVAVVAVVVFVERANGKSRSTTPSAWSGRVYGGQSTHLPLKVNTAGRDPAHLRLLAAPVPGDAGELRPARTQAVRRRDDASQAR